MRYCPACRLTIMLATLALAACSPEGATTGRATPLPTAMLRMPARSASNQVLIPTFTPSPTLAPTAPPTPAPTATPPVSSPTAGTDTEAYKGELLDLVNQLRAQNGCPPLASDPLLAQAAQAHADDMQTNQRIDHVGSDGARYQDRLNRVAYPYQLFGENIAASYLTPREVMAMWTEGDEIPNGPHRLNILNCAYTAAGVGLAYSADGYPYWVLDLASRAS